jgi:hypothetical protein
VTLSAAGTVVAQTSSDSDGEFVFCQVANGSYSAVADLAGYSESPPVTITVSGSAISRADLALTPTTPSGATVHGFLRNTSGGGIAGACVGLYAVSGTTETLVQLTRTNTAGLYLFGQISAGQYLVKAKDEVTL